MGEGWTADWPDGEKTGVARTGKGERKKTALIWAIGEKQRDRRTQGNDDKKKRKERGGVRDGRK
jgi:hypothetical protein